MWWATLLPVTGWNFRCPCVPSPFPLGRRAGFPSNVNPVSFDYSRLSLISFLSGWYGFFGARGYSLSGLAGGFSLYSFDTGSSFGIKAALSA